MPFQQRHRVPPSLGSENSPKTLQDLRTKLLPPPLHTRLRTLRR